MQVPAFNHAEAKWDKYQAFHNLHGRRYSWDTDGLIVTFDTGEAIVTRSYVKVDQRGPFKDFNISILSPRDPRFPRVTTPDGTPVPQNWLTRGSVQHFIVDHDSGRVTALGSMFANKDIPLRFRKFNVCAYLSGSGSIPDGVPVKLAQTKRLTKDERAHIAKLRAQCRAWMQFSEDVNLESEQVRAMRNTGPVWLTWSYAHGLGQLYLLTVQNFMTDMDPFDRCRLAVYGTHAAVERTSVPYLLVA